MNKLQTKLTDREQKSSQTTRKSRKRKKYIYIFLSKEEKNMNKLNDHKKKYKKYTFLTPT